MKQSLQRNHIIEHVRDRYGTEPEYLWADTPDAAVFRHSASKKWYSILMKVLPDRLGLAGSEAVDILNVKCSPLMIDSLLSEPGFFPAYHMNKSKWISILLDDAVPDGQIFSLLELSYDSVAPKRRKKHPQQAEV